MNHHIPFNKPFMVGKELYYIAQAVLSGHTAGNGAFTKRCEALMEDRFDALSVQLTTSCTTALEMAAILCDIGEGDEVLMPSYTFVSTANAFYLRGARPVFVDIRRDTLNLDESLIEDAVTERAKAVVPMHYAGVSCEMDAILDVARRHDLLVIEDAAQGVNARYRNRWLGTIGDVGTYSFHETKNLICGEGGAILVNREDLRNRAEVIREKGTNRSQFFRGEVDKYTWVDVGSSFLPSEILAAFLFAQLENMEVITERRRELFENYRGMLDPLAERGLITLPTVPDHCSSNYHMFQILVSDLETRQALIAYLKEQGILAVFHYVPLHTSPMGERFGYRKGMLPVTEEYSERLVRLPFFHGITADELAEVTQAVFGFFGVSMDTLQKP